MRAFSERPSKFKWSDHLPNVMFNFNTDYHSSIRTTAFKAVFGIEHNTGDKKTITNIEEDSLTFDSYDRLVKKDSLTFDSYDRIVKRDILDDEEDSFHDADEGMELAVVVEQAEMAQVELEIPQTDSREQIRDQVNWNQERNADMMVRQTTRKIKHNLIKLKVGDFVTITEPKEDRQRLPTPRIPGAINRVMLNGYYEIKTSGGIIDRKFRAENIGKYNGSIDLSNSELTTFI